MIREELLDTRYYLEINGVRINSNPKNFKSEKEAEEYYSQHFTDKDNVVIIKEDAIIRREDVSTLRNTKYIITCKIPTYNEKLYVVYDYDKGLVYLSPFKTQALEKYNYCTNEEAANELLDFYKQKSSKYYVDEIIDNMKIEVIHGGYIENDV